MRTLKLPFSLLALIFLLTFSSCRTIPPDHVELDEYPYPPIEEQDLDEAPFPEDYPNLNEDEDYDRLPPLYPAPDHQDEDRLPPLYPAPVHQDEDIDDLYDETDDYPYDQIFDDAELIDDEALLIYQEETEPLFDEEPPPVEIPIPVFPQPPVQPPPVQPPPALPEPLPPAPPVQVPPPPQPQPPPVFPPDERPEPPAFLRPAEPEFTPPPAMIPMPDLHEPPAPRVDHEMVFSRIVRATVGQIIEVPFWRTGWVYLGELGNRRGVNYSSRRLDVQAGTTIGQTFIFIAETPGTYILRFFRQDFIQNYLLYDYVQVIVGERRDDTARIDIHNRDRIIAEPRWPLERGPQQDPLAMPPFESGDPGFQQLPVTPGANLQMIYPSLPGEATAQPTLPPLPPPRIESQDEFIQRARQEFYAARVEQALSVLDDMRQQHPNDNAEALWLRAQLLEANSPARDIRLSLEYYRRLIREFPQSVRVPEARRRIAFLERFFFNIM